MRLIKSAYILPLLVFCCTPKEVSPRLNHVLLQVSSMEQSVDFYTRAFDLEVTNDDIKHIEVTKADGSKTQREVNIVLLKFPGQDFVYELSEVAAGSSISPPGIFNHVGIDVKDIDQAWQRALQAGAQELVPVQLVQTTGIQAKQAFLKGPDGEVIELMQIISGEY